MGRIIALDFGLKRIGIAVTDENQIIAHSLDTVANNDIMDYLKNYLSSENVEEIIIGEPKRLNNEEDYINAHINAFKEKIEKTFNNIPVKTIDERFTSKMATNTIIQSGIGKKARQNKSLVDKVAATILLQTYLEMKSNKK